MKVAHIAGALNSTIGYNKYITTETKTGIYKTALRPILKNTEMKMKKLTRVMQIKKCRYKKEIQSERRNEMGQEKK